MNILFEKSDQVKYQTYLGLMIDALGDIYEDYDWLVSSVECNMHPNHSLEGKPKIINGKKLKELVSGEKEQIIWGVFSALPIGIKPQYKEIPWVDGNPMFWKGSPTTQVKNAIFEIVCWDSTSTLLIGLTNELAKKFMSKYTDSIDLDEYNKKIIAKQ